MTTTALATITRTPEVLPPETDDERLAREIPRLEAALVAAPRGSAKRAELAALLRDIETHLGRIFVLHPAS